jgi:hypothetical protein
MPELFYIDCKMNDLRESKFAFLSLNPSANYDIINTLKKFVIFNALHRKITQVGRTWNEYIVAILFIQSIHDDNLRQKVAFRNNTTIERLLKMLDIKVQESINN